MRKMVKEVLDRMEGFEGWSIQDYELVAATKEGVCDEEVNVLLTMWDGDEEQPDYTTLEVVNNTKLMQVRQNGRLVKEWWREEEFDPRIERFVSSLTSEQKDLLSKVLKGFAD